MSTKNILRVQNDTPKDRLFYLHLLGRLSVGTQRHSENIIHASNKRQPGIHSDYNVGIKMNTNNVSEMSTRKTLRLHHKTADKHHSSLQDMSATHTLRVQHVLEKEYNSCLQDKSARQILRLQHESKE